MISRTLAKHLSKRDDFLPMASKSGLLNEQDSYGDETQAPSARRVARRMLALMAVAARGLIEPYSQELDSDVARLDIITWLDQLGIWDELEPFELELLNTPVGDLDPPYDIDAAWRIEAVAALAWALKLYQLPGYDEPAHVGALREVVLFLNSDACQLIDNAQLRDQDELDAFGDQMFALHWRLNYFYQVSREPLDFKMVAKNSRLGELNIVAARLIDGDLAIKESSIVNAHDDERHICKGIVSERHQAANWLSGYNETYSLVETAT